VPGLIPPLAADKTYGIDVERQRRLAARFGGLRIEQPGVTERQLDLVGSSRMLVQQKPRSVAG